MLLGIDMGSSGCKPDEDMTKLYCSQFEKYIKFRVSGENK